MKEKPSGPTETTRVEGTYEDEEAEEELVGAFVGAGAEVGLGLEAVELWAETSADSDSTAAAPRNRHSMIGGD